MFDTIVLTLYVREMSVCYLLVFCVVLLILGVRLSVVFVLSNEYDKMAIEFVLTRMRLISLKKPSFVQM